MAAGAGEEFPKSQCFVLGQRLTGQALDLLDLLDLLVEASYAREKSEILATANRSWKYCAGRCGWPRIASCSHPRSSSSAPAP